jgi:penicillin-binding protein 2
LNLHNRKYIIQAIFLFIGVIFVIRLFFLQVVDDSFAISANSNVLREITVYPARGIIYDRNQRIMVQNQAIYDLMVVPGQVSDKIDTARLCEMISISEEEFSEKIKKAARYSRYKSSLFEKQLSARTYAELQEHMFSFPGFYVQVRTVRDYPYPIGSHILGYVSEVNENIIGASDNYYKSGDYVGFSGVEKVYEPALRGQRGVKNIMVDVFNRAQGSYADGKYDTLAVAGQEIISTIDLELQIFGEKLMNNKKGSIVAIEPSTGEVLAMVSSPSYDPNLLVGRARSANYSALYTDENKPLFNRATMAQYPPGSIFKLVMALIGKKHGIKDWFYCPGYYRNGSHTVKCHDHPSSINLKQAISYSCNAYFCNSFKTMMEEPQFNGSSEDAFNHWREEVASFGLGQKLGLDLPNELKGLLPASTLYDKYYGRGRWKASTIISLGIGQGELGITPLQMANIMAIIANRGHYYIPHLVKNKEEFGELTKKYLEEHKVSVPTSDFEEVIDGMQMVVDKGTGFWSRIDSIVMCGKTGTVENPHGKDHSVFVAFAPRDNPKIAIAVVVENSGYGATWAAPIASLMIEKYLKGYTTKPWIEQKMYDTDFINKPEKKQVTAKKD